ncbi:hypothetical protein DFH94DRAFT_152096 [Russula ochroleuca]|uniref:Uncharacterized protein n=1 Tax=Russula ochroleuca TaxID=152965 RepID=A0A9P5N3H3_9AGAM|nr:hypothetical protein DFH94DRAFT_152096 [Russula ochroleuca]
MAFLSNSGLNLNAKAGLFAFVPQSDDALLHDEAIHVSVHDDVRATRVSLRMRCPFAHNEVCSSHVARCARALRDGWRARAVVSSPSSEQHEWSSLRAGSPYLVIEEVHATSLYRPGGRGMVAPLGLEVEDCVLARLYTFGKASAASDASGDAYQAHYQ